MKIEKDDWLNELLELSKNLSFGGGIVVGFATILKYKYIYGYAYMAFLIFMLGVGAVVISFSLFKFFNNVFRFSRAKRFHFSPKGFFDVVAAAISALVFIAALIYAVHLPSKDDHVLKCSGGITVLYN